MGFCCCYYLFKSFKNSVLLNPVSKVLSYHILAAAHSDSNVCCCIANKGAEQLWQWHLPVIPVAWAARAGGLKVQAKRKQFRVTLSQKKK